MPKALIAVRFFDTTATYVLNDMVVQAGKLYEPTATSPPGAFNASNWTEIGSAGTAAMVGFAPGGNIIATNVQAAIAEVDAEKAAITYVDAADAALASSKADKTYVDAADALKADKTYVDAQDALKVSKAGDTMTGHLALPTGPANPNAVRKDYCDANYNALAAQLAGKAGLAGPVFTGDPRAPTQTAGDNDTSIATTAFVQSAVNAAVPAAATAAEYLANSAPTKMLTPGAAWAAAGAITLTEAASMVPDLSLGIDFQLNMTASGNTIADPINIKPGQKGVIFIAQDATGSRTLAGWGAKWKFPGGVKPTLSTAPFAWDAVSYFVRTVNAVLCISGADFK